MGVGVFFFFWLWVGGVGDAKVRGSRVTSENRCLHIRGCFYFSPGIQDL